MLLRCHAVLVAALGIIFSFNLYGETITPANNNSTEHFSAGKIVVVSNPIFDESAKDAFFIHRWANYLHINTQEFVILDNLSFEAGDQVSENELREAERILRAKPFITDAKIYLVTKDSPVEKAPNAVSEPEVDHNTFNSFNAASEDSETIVVETWDNWSLLPTFSFGHSGGNNKISVGVKDDNLLGLGIRTDLKYQSDVDRTGYKVAFEAPLEWIQHATVAVDFLNNSDGRSQHVYFEKPFYTLDSENIYSAEYLDETRIDNIRQNGSDVNEFQHVINNVNVRYGWLQDKSNDELARIILGFTQDKNTFSQLDSFPDSVLPQDRDYLYPWIAYEYLQDEFAVLNNVHLIHDNEDFNLGWHHYFQLGIETKDVNRSSPIGYHLNWQTSRGYKYENELLLITLLGDATLATSQKDFYLVTAKTEYFYQINPKWTAYANARLSNSQNNPIDIPFALGDDTGVRGYPNDYQHGDNQWLLNAELRNYPNINLYQFAELGWAVFSDVGQAFGGPDENNETSGVIGSVGIGARIFSSKSSYGNVAHVDIAFPFTSGEEVHSWEWRFQVKSHF